MWINALDEISNSLTVHLRGFASRFYWLYLPLKEVWVEFYLEDKKIGEAKTNKKGFFSLNYTFQKPGLYEITIKPQNSSSPKESLNILIVKPNEKLVVCDIDHTLMEVSAFAFIANRKTPPMEGALETLKILEKNHHILYLTHRETRFAHITKKWLKDFDFPTGPLFLWSYKHHPFKNESYKTNALKRIVLRSSLPLKMAFGDKESDLEAYKNAGVKKIVQILGPQDWKKLKEEL